MDGGWEGEQQKEEQVVRTEIGTEIRGKYSSRLKKLDLKILGLLETWGALGLGQIEGACAENFENSARLVALLFNESFRYAGKFYLRLRHLQERGLVAVQRENYQRQVYKLTPIGHWALYREWEAQFEEVQETVSPATMRHRVIGAGVGLLISRFLGLEVVSERQFHHVVRGNLGGRRPVGFHLPDLVLNLPEGQGRCPIEIELHQKPRHRYEELWAYYRGSLAPKDTLLYLTSDPRFSIRLLGLAERYGADFLFACDLPAFREALGRSRFLNFKGREFRL